MQSALVDRSAKDPIIVEVISNRLNQIISEAAQTLKRVSGAVLTVDAADFAIDLFDAEGNTFVYSPVGLPRQGSAVRQTLPVVLKELGQDPGIFPGDIIITNDPYSCTLHIVDLQMVKPLYYHDELTMWIGVGIHKVDMGGMIPGIPLQAKNAYQEGILIPPVKLFERGKLRREILNLYMSNVRSRHTQELDLRGQIAATQNLEQRLLEIINHFGIDTFKSVVRKLMDSSENVVRQRVATIPDGTYEFTDYLDHDGQTDNIYTVKCTLTVDGDSGVIDFRGTDPQSPGAANSTIGCTYGAIHAGLLALVAPDLAPNEGVFKPFKEIIPEASLFWTKHPAPCSAGATEAGYRSQCVFLGAMSKAAAASTGELREMAVSGQWGGTCITVMPAGIDQYGRNFVATLFEGIAMGGGARSYKDGMGAACLHTTVGAQFSNVETLEREYPFLWLKRSYLQDSPGAGKHRGGPSMDVTMVVHDTDRLEVGQFHSRRYPPSWGVFGGGPGCAAWVKLKRESNVYDVLKERVPVYEEVGGEEEIMPQKFVTEFRRGDTFRCMSPGGGGHGDPLEREPERVLEDVLDEYISLESAKRLYGVIIDLPNRVVDQKATATLREQVRKERLNRPRAVAASA
ncbi:MAG: hydantoinase B/oxoprolinase family protein [Firmicutes bacterium]|nr:hydantoinase B/oxoprolinase family protein [Bacillota bacterium]